MRVEIFITLFLDVFRRNDHAAITRELRQQHRIGLLHDEIDGVVVDHVHALDRIVVRLLRTFLSFFSKESIEAELDGGCVEWLTVMELDVLAQLEPNAAVVVEKLPGRGEPWLELHVRAAGGEPVEDVGGGRGPIDDESVDGVPAAWIERDRDRDGSGGLRAGGRERCGGRGGDKAECLEVS